MVGKWFTGTMDSSEGTDQEQGWTLRRGPRRRWVRWIVSAVVLWVTIVVTMAWFEESLIFFPDPYPSGIWDTEAVAEGSGCTVEDCFFEASDGVRLHAWWVRPGKPAAQSPTSDMVLLLFHGNAGNLSHRADMVLDLARIPVQVLIVDYRGYGRSEGRPNEKGVYRDARAAWRFLTVDHGVGADRVVLFGKSLGGAVAVDLATEVAPAGLVVQSSFSSVPAMASHHYPFIPGRLVRTRMDSLSKIGAIACPKLFIHSRNDEVVPFEQGRQLYEAAGGDKRFFEIIGAGHNETWLVGGENYRRAIRDFVADCAPGRGGSR